MKEEDAKEYFDERSAIREFDGGQSREVAEAKARIETHIHIFRCLIRHLIRWKEQGRRNDVISWLDASDVNGGRDPDERKLYADALNQQIKLGNKGNAGDWRF